MTGVKSSELRERVKVSLRASSMASTTQQHSSSRFSTFKIFRLAGSKPPPPPPKDAIYLYPSTNNPSLVSLSNKSVHSSSSPKQTNPSGPLSIRSPSPTPSRVLQSSSPQQLHPPPPPVYQQHQSPPASTSSSATLSPDLGSSSSKRSFFRKMSGLRKRSASKSSHMTTTEDATDDESISRPWNFQVSPPFHLSLLPMALTPNFFFFISVISFPCHARGMFVYPYPHILTHTPPARI